MKNEPAFPSIGYTQDASGGISSSIVMNPGASLRDYFAAKATEEDIKVTIPRKPEDFETFRQTHGFEWSREWSKYQYADRMLAVRD